MQQQNAYQAVTGSSASICCAESFAWSQIDRLLLPWCLFLCDLANENRKQSIELICSIRIQCACSGLIGVNLSSCALTHAWFIYLKAEPDLRPGNVLVLHVYQYTILKFLRHVVRSWGYRIDRSDWKYFLFACPGQSFYSHASKTKS